MGSFHGDVDEFSWRCRRHSSNVWYKILSYLNGSKKSSAAIVRLNCPDHIMSHLSVIRNFSEPLLENKNA